MKHDNPHVSNGLKQAGDWLTKALGVQGYRLDYVKGISFTFLGYYLNFGAMAGKFAVGEFQGSRRVGYRTRNSTTRSRQRPRLPPARPLEGDVRRQGFLRHELARPRRPDREEPHRLGDLRGKSRYPAYYPPARIVNNKHLAYAYILTSEGYPVVFYRDYFDFGLKAVINNLIWIYEKDRCRRDGPAVQEQRCFCL